MDTEDLPKTVDNIYKNILEKFNPGARQLITTGKSYLKALHGAASATRIFNESLAKVALNAQQSEINDIGSALLGIVGVYKEIQEQQMNILKAFYVDLLVPLETNLEKDTKVVQYEQKKFMQQHKIRLENYQKAVSTMKKQRKKKSSNENNEKEIRNMQMLQEQKKKLEAFCEQSYKNAITQERRRYGFVLERQCSIAKHLMAYHSTGRIIIEQNLENWQKVAASREILPDIAFDTNGEIPFKGLERMKNFDDFNGDNMSQLKKSCSVDAPYGDMRTLHETKHSYMQNSLSRAKSDFNIAVKKSTNDLNDHGGWDQRVVVKALYGYMPSGENQLPFEEGDRIALVGGKANGWQFGENLRLKIFGWFPIAYTNAEGNVYAGNYKDLGTADMMSDMKAPEHGERYESMQYNRSDMMSDYTDQGEDDLPAENGNGSGYRQAVVDEVTPTRLFSDMHNTRNNKNNKKYRASPNNNPRPGPPPTLPAPVPTVQNRILNLSRSFCTPNGPPPSLMEHRRKQKAPNANNHNENSSHMLGNHHMNETSQTKSAEATKTSLHSSNDSGFANEPPPQPAVDYSDEEQNQRVPIRRSNDKLRNKMPHELGSLTLTRSYRTSISSQNENEPKSLKTPHTLIASDDEILQTTNGGSVRRTKSFWKFRGKRGNDDILAGMALWQHRDLVVPPETEIYERHNTNTLTKQKSTNNSDRKHSFGSLMMFDGEEVEENIYGSNESREMNGTLSKKELEIDEKSEDMSTLRRNHNNNKRNGTLANAQQKIYNKQKQQQQQQQQQQQKQQQQQQRQHVIYANEDADEFASNATLKMNNKVKDYFDDMHANDMNSDGGLLVKTVKRKDILKQYYTSDTDVDDDESEKPEDDEDEEEELDDDETVNDVETVKSDFDPYDCIVINDHLVRKDEAHQRHLRAKTYHEQEIKFQTFRATMTKTQSLSLEKTPASVRVDRQKQQLQQQQQQQEQLSLPSENEQRARYKKPAPARREQLNLTSPTATILPRTRLIKSTASTVLGARVPTDNLVPKMEKSNNTNKDAGNSLHDNQNSHYSKTYGPWFDFWDLQKQEQYLNQTLNRQKPTKNAHKN